MTARDDERDWPFWARDKIVQRHGGLIDPGYLDEFHRVTCGFVRRMFLQTMEVHSEDFFADQFERLTLFFIDNHSVNALALERENRRGIGVHLGTVRQLWWLFYRAVSSDIFLTQHFDSAPAKRETSLQSAMDDPIWREKGAGRLPADRAELMFDLFLRAIDFFLYHEFAHHARGHLPYLREVIGMTVIDETANMSVLAGDDNEVLRYIEFDADLDALDLLVTSLDRELPLGTWPDDEAGTEFYLHAVAMLGVFQLLDMDHAPINRQYHGSHPAPVHRAMRATGALSRAIGDQVGWTDKRRIEMHDKAWFAAADLASLAGMPPGRWHGDTTDLMDIDRLAKEEKAFFDFSAKLTEYNTEVNERED